MRIERHVKEHRAAARSQGARTGFDSFPLRATGFVEVNVGVNNTRKNVQARAIDLLTRLSASECSDLTFRNGEVRLTFASRSNDRSTTQS
jgi:hypothetical protein